MAIIEDNLQNRTLSKLAQRLVNQNLLTESRAFELQAAAREDKCSLVTQLINEQALPSLQVADTAAREFGVPLLDLSAFNLEFAPTEDVSENLIRKHHALPLQKRGNKLFVAVSDPTKLQALDEIKFNTGLFTEVILVEHDKLTQAIESTLNATGGLASFDNNELDQDDLLTSDEDSADTDATAVDEDDAPIVRFVNKILLDAIHRGASDIHFEPYEHSYRVRFRQDGVLQDVAEPPAGIAMRLSARLKVLARLDLAERRIPQDGRIKLNISKNKAIDFRVSSCPTLFGEKIVLRILDPTSAQMGIDSLGYEPHQQQLFTETIHKPYGMVLVTGPTGSGKTVSLYTALNILNTEDRNISTAEDPAEINLPGINQVNVHPKVGLTFASALRAFLRQDPDVIMVGEIRDLETAEIAIKAAQTGHMVLSTLHTNDAPSTLSRLLNMGVPAYNIASSVSLIIAQRLARRLCSECKIPADIPREELLREGFNESELDTLGVHEPNPNGCKKCTSGFKGRVGIYQVMPVTDAIGKIIMQDGTAYDIENQATEDGIIDLRRAGLNKVAQGMTSLAEVNRVTVE